MRNHPRFEGRHPIRVRFVDRHLHYVKRPPPVEQDTPMIAPGPMIQLVPYPAPSMAMAEGPMMAAMMGPTYYNYAQPSPGVSSMQQPYQQMPYNPYFAV